MAFIPAPNQSSFADPGQTIYGAFGTILNSLQIRDARQKQEADDLAQLLAGDPELAAQQVLQLGPNGLRKRYGRVLDEGRIQALIKESTPIPGDPGAVGPVKAGELPLDQAQPGRARPYTTTELLGQEATRADISQKRAQTGLTGAQAKGIEATTTATEAANRLNALLEPYTVEGARLQNEGQRIANVGNEQNNFLAFMTLDARAARPGLENDAIAASIANTMANTRLTNRNAKLADLDFEAKSYLLGFQKQEMAQSLIDTRTGRPLDPGRANRVLTSLMQGKPLPANVRLAGELEKNINQYRTGLIAQGLPDDLAAERATAMFIDHPFYEQAGQIEAIRAQGYLYRMQGDYYKNYGLAQTGTNVGQAWDDVRSVIDTRRQLVEQDPLLKLIAVGGETSSSTERGMFWWSKGDAIELTPDVVLRLGKGNGTTSEDVLRDLRIVTGDESLSIEDLQNLRITGIPLGDKGGAGMRGELDATATFQLIQQARIIAKRDAEAAVAQRDAAMRLGSPEAIMSAQQDVDLYKSLGHFEGIEQPTITQPKQGDATDPNAAATGAPQIDMATMFASDDFINASPDVLMKMAVDENGKFDPQLFTLFTLQQSMGRDRRDIETLKAGGK